MPIVSSLVLPHAPALFTGGDECSAAEAERKQSLPESLKEDLRKVFRATHEAAEMAKAAAPEVIFLSSPHGVSLWNSVAVPLNSKAKGNAGWNSQWTEYGVDVALDVDLASAFLKHLQSDNIPAEGIMHVEEVFEAPLQWGEVVPLWFFRDLTSASVKVVIFSYPRTKHQAPLSDTTKVGASIAKFLNNLPQRVLYISGGELSHNHETDCTLPLYLPDPKWSFPKSSAALPFDLSIAHWVLCTPFGSEGDVTQPIQLTEEHSTILWDQNTCKVAQQRLAKATDLENSVYSCGFYGIRVLHGILAAEVDKGATYDAHLLCQVAPTYFGMMVAAFTKKDS